MNLQNHNNTANQTSQETHPRNGHVRLPNEVVERLAQIRFPQASWQIILVVLRKTIGWQKQPEQWQNRPYPISCKDLADATGLDRRRVQRHLSQLTKRGVIIRENNGWKPAITRFNLSFWEWEVGDLLGEGVVSTEATRSVKLDHYPSVNSGATLVSTETTPLGTNQARLKKPKETLNKQLKKHAPFLQKGGVLSDTLKKTIAYYLRAYEQHKGKPHPRLDSEQWRRMVAELDSFSDEYDVSDFRDFQTVIDYHFTRKLKTDYNICHFATEGILRNLYYKQLY